MSNIHTLTPIQLQQWRQQKRRFVLLDVRENHEIARAALPEHTHIPMHLIAQRHHELARNCPIVVYCHHGVRSLQTALYLAHMGFDEVYNLSGGIDAWSQTVDTTVTRY